MIIYTKESFIFSFKEIDYILYLIIGISVLKQITLENYRCFKESQLTVRDLTVIVGKNNAGKSTAIEAIRIISMATRKYKTANYISPPQSLSLEKQFRGFRLPVENFKIDLRSIVYFYGKTNAVITVEFHEKSKIVIYLNTEIAFATIWDANDNMITNRSQTESINIGELGILPQIGLIKENEKQLTDKTITKDLDTYLSSRHFRNEMLLFKEEYFEDFKELSEKTWESLRVRDLSYDFRYDEFISLIIDDAGFSSEIGLMGSGIQMWLQIIWSICKAKNCNTIILDEPDVYMHPEMQIKILRLVTSRFKQVIIATHSIEIISNVSPRSIVTVDKDNKKMVYANKLGAVQDIIEDIGSIYNLSLSRLNSAKKCLFVEGKDLKILQQFYSILFPDSIENIADIPCLPLGGFSRINETFGASRLFFDNSKGAFKCYAILDSDYYSKEKIDQIKEKAKENHLILFVLSKKEIENYFIVPSVIFKLISNPKDSFEFFQQKLGALVDEYKENIIYSYTTKIQEEDRSHITAGKAAAEASRFINSKWDTLEDKISLAPGKDLLKHICKWMKEEYKTTCSMKLILDKMNISDIDSEIDNIINEIIK